MPSSGRIGAYPEGAARLGMRIVAVSDLHGNLPKTPACDLLIVAGDVCPDRAAGRHARDRPELQANWVREVFFPWIAEAGAERSVLTWGNHDWCGMSAVEARRLVADAPAGATVLVDALLSVPDGTSAVSVWASPWSNQFMNWAFMKTPGELAEVYAAIPPGTDIVVSHQPPHGFGDRFVDVITGRIEHLGSRELLATIERVRPKMVVCGHIHDGHGRYIHAGVPIYNVSIVNEQYRRVYQPTVIELS